MRGLPKMAVREVQCLNHAVLGLLIKNLDFVYKAVNSQCQIHHFKDLINLLILWTQTYRSAGPTQTRTQTENFQICQFHPSQNNAKKQIVC